MQNTRLNSLFERTVEQSTQWLQNPWRRLSINIILLLFGNLFASVLATTTGQTADLDVLVALIALVLIELVNWLVYRRRVIPGDRPSPARWWKELLNCIKLGFIYGMLVQALTLGS